MSFQTIDPTNESVIAEYDFQNERDVDQAITLSQDAFQEWRRLPLEKRLHCVSDFAKALTGARSLLAEMMTREMGKTLKESLGEVDKCIASCKTLT
jgi:acyl-CoA reductase-like NAD-dependent aldehyde dehydrogenase